MQGSLVAVAEGVVVGGVVVSATAGAVVSTVGDKVGDEVVLATVSVALGAADCWARTVVGRDVPANKRDINNPM
jgi:hypothetical protein